MAESDLTTQVMTVLQEYDERVAEKLDKGSQKCAQGLRKDLGVTSPYLTGSYSKSWTNSTTKEFTKGNKEFTIHNKKAFHSTHLLEKPHSGPHGHGTVTTGWPHIAPAEKKWTEEFEKTCEEACKG